MTFIPKRLRKTVGIEFTHQGLHMSVANANGGTINVLVVRDVSFGEEVDETAIPPSAFEPVKEFVKRHHLKGARAVLGVSNPRSVVRCLKLPKIPEKALKQAVDVSIGTTIHLPFEDPMFDVAPLGPVSPEEQFVCLVATSRELVKEMVTFVRSVGLRPVAIEIPPLALWRLFTRDHEASGLSLLVDLDDTGACLSLFIGDKLYFSRFVRMELHQFGEQRDIESIVNDLAFESDRVVNFFNYNLSVGAQTLERIVLHSKVDESELLVSTLAARMNRTVTLLKPPLRLKRASVGASPRCFTSVGLAIRERF
jgi:Tfp pilus assembly PilM family ATPase